MNQRLSRPSFHPRQRESGGECSFTFAYSVIPLLDFMAPPLSQTGGEPPSQSRVSANTIAPFRRNVTRLVMPTQVHHSGKYYLHRRPPRHNRIGPENSGRSSGCESRAESPPIERAVFSDHTLCRAGVIIGTTPQVADSNPYLWYKSNVRHCIIPIGYDGHDD